VTTPAIPFADIEADIASDTMAMLANAVARTQDGDEFPVIFDADFVAPLGLVDSVGPSAVALDSDLAAYDVEQDVQLTIRSVAYVVRSVQPDGAGQTRLLLRIVPETP
jgi:hypothetical protein